MFMPDFAAFRYLLGEKSELEEELMICTCHGADAGALTPDDLLLCNLSGEMVEGEERPTSEIDMHRRAYAMRPEIMSVVHAHPPTATAFAAASVSLDQLQAAFEKVHPEMNRDGCPMETPSAPSPRSGQPVV